ncbi:MAG: SGNH/GDSL hydrolase family protein [Cyanobacteria bacterium]|nr:SGNH/GDSL hydrolase family protein [Cyanobacteriota bacterium]
MVKRSPFAAQPTPDPDPNPAPRQGTQPAVDSGEELIQDAAIAPPIPGRSRAAVRVMPLGDSLTEGDWVPGGYRMALKSLLEKAGHGITYVGSQRNGPVAELGGDRAHEGHSGWRIDELRTEVRRWLGRAEPEVVLLLAGTNDIAQDYAVDRMVRRLATLVNEIGRVRPTGTVLVATLPPIAEARLDRWVRAYNEELRDWVAQEMGAGRAIALVELYDAVAWEDLPDGFHPNRRAHDRMAERWAAVLVPILKARQGMNP